MTDIIYHPESNDLFVGNYTSWEEDAGCTIVAASDLHLGSQIHVGLGQSKVLPAIDFETYSEAGFILGDKVRGIGSQGKGGLPVVGTPVYAEHPSTEVLCLYYDLKNGAGRRGWFPSAPNPTDLLQYVQSGGLVEAWNVTFEWYIWNMVCTKRYGWPPLPLEQCRCAMAKSRRYSLPGALGKAAQVLGTDEKDRAGHNLLQKLSRPHTRTKNRQACRWTPATAWEDFAALYAYCGQDIVAEDECSARIPDLTDYEFKTWLTDQTINARGVQVDTQALDAMLVILEQTERKYTMRLANLTGGAVGSVSEVAKFRNWVHSRGNYLPDLTKDTVRAALNSNELRTDVRQALQIRETLGAANIKKLRTLKLQVSSDGRLRDQYKYCGADRTGRWAAGGVQLQNITAKGPKTCKCESCELTFVSKGGDIGCPRCGAWMFHELPEWTVDQVEHAIDDLQFASGCTFSAEANEGVAHIERIWGDPIALMCGCLRGLFTARPGYELVCCDFSAIEAVVLACLSRCQWRIDLFSDPNRCIYTESASKITGKPMAEYWQHRAENGNKWCHGDRKKYGKVAELALGYSGWINAMLVFGADKYFSEDEMKEIILKWRADNPDIVDMWGGQFRWCGPGKWDYVPELHGLEGAAINAVLNPGQCFSHYDITYGVKDDVLMCRLPSGRFLNYHRPRLVGAQDKLNRGPAVSLTFEGYNSNAAKGRVGWSRMETFGGRLTENVTQAVALDIQAEALVRLEAAGYPVVMHTHDEAVCEVPVGWGSVEEMQAIMSQRPSWANWWPIKAAGWRHTRYQKD